MSNSVVYRPEGEYVNNGGSDSTSTINTIDGFPIKILERRQFAGVVIDVGLIYIDSNTKDIYIGDGMTPGGVPSTDFFKMSGIWGGPIKNPKFEINISGGIF